MTTLHFVLWFACFSYTGANYSTSFRPLSPMDYFVGSENTLFFVRPEALLNISKEESSLNLRTILTSKYASGHAYTTRVCWSYNSNKAMCDMEELYLLTNKPIMPQRLLQNITVKETRLPICDVGTGNSGCSSPMYLVSPCGTLENKHTPDCFWSLTVQDSSVIVLNIEVFEIRYSGEQCVMDHLLITEQKDTENGTTKTQLGRFCGHREKWVLVSSTNNITIQLVTHLPKTSKNSMKIAYQHWKQNWKQKSIEHIYIFIFIISSTVILAADWSIAVGYWIVFHCFSLDPHSQCFIPLCHGNYGFDLKFTGHGLVLNP